LVCLQTSNVPAQSQNGSNVLLLAKQLPALPPLLLSWLPLVRTDVGATDYYILPVVALPQREKALRIGAACQRRSRSTHPQGKESLTRWSPQRTVTA
jgi:hypothetical protein